MEPPHTFLPPHNSASGSTSRQTAPAPASGTDSPSPAGGHPTKRKLPMKDKAPKVRRADDDSGESDDGGHRKRNRLGLACKV